MLCPVFKLPEFSDLGPHEVSVVEFAELTGSRVASVQPPATSQRCVETGEEEVSGQLPFCLTFPF